MEKLYIPYGLKIKKDIIPGFGKKELRQFFVGTAMAVIIAIIAGLISGSLLAGIAGLLLGVFASYIATKRETYSQSIISFINCTIRYKREQQRYDYKYRWKA